MTRFTLPVAAAIASLTLALGATATAQADTGLTFSSCVQSQATALPPCSVNPGVADPTDIGSRATTGITVGVTSASTNTISGFNSITPLSYFGCEGDGPLGCFIHPGPAIDDPEGFAGLGQNQVYVAGAANSAIVAAINIVAFNCVSEAPTPGCGVAHGLTHPRRLVMTPDGGQLYAATQDGVAWFDVAQLAGGDINTQPDGNTTAGALTFVGCLDSDASDTCGKAHVGNEDAIVVSADATSVYAGSTDGSVVGFARAPDGGLTQISCITEADPAPAGCVHGQGLADVSALAISPDGTSLYAVGAGSHTVVTFARAADGTITESSCLGLTTTDRCATDPDLATPISVAVSPDGTNVYAGDTQANAISFDRATDGTLTPTGCLGSTGTACTFATTITHATGKTLVTPDGERVYVVAEDRDGVTQYARGGGKLGIAAEQVAPSTFAVAPTLRSIHHGATGARARHRGTTIRFLMSHAANVKITISLRHSGRIGATRATLLMHARRGLNRLGFSGRVRGRPLALGRYVAAITARSPNEHLSAPLVGFTIVRR
jgi:hypothetical protein